MFLALLSLKVFDFKFGKQLCSHTSRFQDEHRFYPLFVQDCNPYHSKWLSNRTGESGLLLSPIARTWRLNRRSGPCLPPRCCLCSLHFTEKNVKVVGAWTLPLELAKDRTVLSSWLPSCGDVLFPFKHWCQFSEASCSCQAGASWVLPSPRSFRQEAAWEDKLWCTNCSSYSFPYWRKGKLSSTCILKLNIKAFVRVWGERGKKYSV